MKMISIIAHSDHIEIIPQNPFTATPTGRAYVPLLRGQTGKRTPSRMLCESQNCVEGHLIFPRFYGDYDLLIARFEVICDDEMAGGVCYVTDMADDFYHESRDLPPRGKAVGTWVTCPGEDMDAYGFGGMMTEINSTWIQTLTPHEGDISHVWNGKTYWFSRAIMDMYDRMMMPCIERGLPCLLRLINRFSYRLKGSDEALRAVIGHPNYEDTGFAEQMSAFNLTSEEGLDMYCACLDFLSARYANPRSPLFCSVIFDIGNEINAQAVWHNCGAMPCRDFTEEYVEALRLAYLIGQKHNACHRVHISLDHYYATSIHPEDPLRYYGGREVLAYLSAICRRDGDFPWGISAHPYPENLTKPDFYNDTTAIFENDTPRITMKNMEMWQLIATHPALSYRGQPRRVVFDEQGFHTDYDDPESENKGAYAFMLLWEKMKRCPVVEQFLINRYTDMPEGDEGGLHLGLRYECGYADDEHLFTHPGAYKKISHVIRDLGTDAEVGWLEEARTYVGEALFDSLLHPVLPEWDEYFEEIASQI